MGSRWVSLGNFSFGKIISKQVTKTNLRTRISYNFPYKVYKGFSMSQKFPFGGICMSQ